MEHRCGVCQELVAPDERGRVRLEGITLAGTKQWVWGPVVVHEDCRLDLTTPYDGVEGYQMTWERMKA